MKYDNSKENVEVAFARLIGPLATITALESYKAAHKDYKDLLSFIINWSANYMITRKLSLIDHIELLDVYNKLEDLKTKWLFDTSLGEESELADEVVIWIWEIMELRKLEIDKREN